MRFDPYVGGLGGRLFLAILGINDIARRLGLPSLLADLCKHVIKRGEHRLVIESDGALLGSRCGVRFAFGVGGGIDVVAGIRLVTSRTGRAPWWRR